MEKFSPGKLKGLKNISKDGFFIITALDHRNSLKKLINPTNPENVPASLIKTIKVEFTKILAPYSSAILLDPEYGKDACKRELRGEKGLIVSIEESGYAEIRGERLSSLLYDWPVKKIKEELNPDAIKFLLYYNPDASYSSKKQLNLVKKVSKECKKFDITFICEPFVYPLRKQLEKFKIEFPKIVIETANKISKLNVDLLKVQFPGDVNSQSTIELKKNCEELDSVCKQPWVLLSGGSNYEEFFKQAEIASKCNFSGIMVGRALWQEAFEKKSLKEIMEFVRTESLKRLNRLSTIVHNGMPWFERLMT